MSDRPDSATGPTTPAWSSPDGWPTKLFAPNMTTIVATLAIAVVLPILLHLWLYRAKANPKRAGFLILGSSDAGKTSVLNALERSSSEIASPSTFPSQECIVAPVSIPNEFVTESNSLRSENDPMMAARTVVTVVDTPGQRKLRNLAVPQLVSALGLSDPSPSSDKTTATTTTTTTAAAAKKKSWPAATSLAGIIFVVDATATTPNSVSAQQAAEYLYDILLLLQQRYVKNPTSVHAAMPPVLIMANKSDAGTAMLPDVVKSVLEREIGQVRTSRRRVVGASQDVTAEGKGRNGQGFSADTGSEDPFAAFLELGRARSGLVGIDGEAPVLGDERVEFKFDSLAAMDGQVSVVAGNTQTEAGVAGLWEWIAGQV